MEPRRTGDLSFAHATEVPLVANWRLAATAPHTIADTAALDAAGLDWLPALVPGTVAQSMQAIGRWRLGQEFDFDEHDWWYVGQFNAHPSSPGQATQLRFDGLATLAEVYLNGALILRSQNMFLSHVIDVGEWLRDSNELVICFRALNPWLAHRRPRPRWKTRLVKNQQLRWLRTTLLGRMPGWSPPVAPVGPWRAISITATPKVAISGLHINTELRGNEGMLALNCRIKIQDAKTAPKVRLEIAGKQTAMSVQEDKGSFLIEGPVFIDHVRQWYPHTHGKPARYTCVLHVEYGAQRMQIDCGKVAFRVISGAADDENFALAINGEAVFVRGAVWTVEDIVSAGGDRELLRETLTLARDAGLNMLRVSGIFNYEHDAFYELCDELGILVWQDFMFANMDYPLEDEAFRAEVETEAIQVLKRLRRFACVAVYCGNSEVEQEAAMLGLPRDLWRHAFFSEVLPGWCRAHHPGVPYIVSTPSGGALPFHPTTGVSHYYGVGAYRRPLSDVRRARVNFAAECLAFASVPEQSTVELVSEGHAPIVFMPRWKQRVPRDHGPGWWDFEDVRDFYVGQIYGIDPIKLRTMDPVRYLDIGRTVTGEVMTQVFSEWRSVYSGCNGALVWFYKDVWPGAGWGIIDSTGLPKANYYYLKRVWQPLTVVLTDEGLNGLHAHVVNETAEIFRGRLNIKLLRGGHAVVAHTAVEVEVPARGKMALSADAVFGAFHDVAYAYRFGPPQHEVVVATLNAGEQRIAEAFFFPLQQEPSRVPAKVNATVQACNDIEYELTLSSEYFLHAVHFDVQGFLPDDNYFHLSPNETRKILFRRINVHNKTREFGGFVEALNLAEPVMIAMAAPGRKG